MIDGYRAHMVEGEPDAKARACFDCRHCVGYVSWWCTSKAAVERRGSAIPDAAGCQQWEPVPTGKRSWWRRLFGLDTVEIRASDRPPSR